MEVTTVYLLMLLMVTGTLAQFNPTLTVNSCTQNSLVVTLTDGSDSGIIYIQGQGAACKQSTLSSSNQHTFDFSSCGIQWESSFNLIVQRKSLYQTGDDKQIPVMCIADLTDLSITNNINAADKDDDAGQNKTVKPTATMTLYKDGGDVGGGTVKLTDVVTMLLQLDTDYIQDFDIKARDCTASTLDIISGSCAADIELFPHFTHTSQGVLTASFGAFRTTDLNGGSVGMTFSCTLEVCLGSCTATTCSDGQSGWGRKKRAAGDIVKRQAPGGSAFENINVGATIKISADEVVLQDPEVDNGLCMNQAAFIVLMVFLSAGLLVSGIAAMVLTKKVIDARGVLKHLSSGFY